MERRSRLRFPLTLDAHIRCAKHQEVVPINAQTLNISSTGILFATNTLIHLGTEIEAKIDWPGDRPDSRIMFLEISGKVVWSDDNAVGVFINKYRFRAVERSTIIRVNQDVTKYSADAARVSGPYHRVCDTASNSVNSGLTCLPSLQMDIKTRAN